jgi:hypothetical protein
MFYASWTVSEMKPNNETQTGRGGQTSGGSKKTLGIILLAVLAVVVVAVVLQFGHRPPPQNSGAGGNQTPGTSGTLAPGQNSALAGRWYRQDGGYVFEFKQTAEKLEAAYFNPERQINVSKVEATKEGSMTKVVVELRDSGYPGCIYTLLYDQAKDVLRGTYYQAAIQATYEVTFERLKE